jgi:hypothetical protein
MSNADRHCTAGYLRTSPLECRHCTTFSAEHSTCMSIACGREAPSPADTGPGTSSARLRAVMSFSASTPAHKTVGCKTGSAEDSTVACRTEVPVTYTLPLPLRGGSGRDIGRGNAGGVCMEYAHLHPHSHMYCGYAAVLCMHRL